MSSFGINFVRLSLCLNVILGINLEYGWKYWVLDSVISVSLPQKWKKITTEKIIYDFLVNEWQRWYRDFSISWIPIMFSVTYSLFDNIVPMTIYMLDVFRFHHLYKGGFGCVYLSINDLSLCSDFSFQVNPRIWSLHACKDSSVLKKMRILCFVL
jgi:hypothetical protein